MSTRMIIYYLTVSHAPHFISFALAKKINDMKYIENNPWILDKGSLSDMARIAKSDPQAWANIFLNNEKFIGIHR